MSEKAELVEQLEHKELTIIKLAGETETIGNETPPPPFPHIIQPLPLPCSQESMSPSTRIRGKL